MTTRTHRSVGALIWAWAGRVPLRQKIIGIIVAPMVILGFTIAWWVSSQLGGWLSYLLTEERVAQAMAVGMRSVFIITIFSAVAGLGVGSLLTWFLTRPVIDMTYVARRVKNGDLSMRAPVWANDEIGELGRAFNDMIGSLAASRQELERFNEQLQHRNRELGVLYLLADMANRPHTIDEISAQSLGHTLENTGASAGLIALLTDQTPAITASYHLPEAFTRLVSQHLPMLCAQTQPGSDSFELQIIEDIRSAAQLPLEFSAQAQMLGYQGLILAPIVVKDELLGLLLLLCAEPSLITTPPYRQMIGGICNQLGMTLQNNRLWDELRQKEYLRAQLLNKVVSAQEEERQRISRELHDETGQALTSLLVQLKLLERSDNLTDIKAQMEDIRLLVLRTLQEVRRLAADLRPAALDDLGLISALEGYIYNYASKTQIAVDFQTHDVDSLRLAHEVEIVLYRVIQEALTNIARHAGASAVTVSIARQQERITVCVQDDGRGFNVHALRNKGDYGLGILGMQERIELIGGKFSIDSKPGLGTQIHVEVTVT